VEVGEFEMVTAWEDRFGDVQIDQVEAQVVVESPKLRI
jgi:hypothetical protein